MTTFLQFAILGLGIGAVYALLAQGILVIYNGSGVLNLAHGAMAMVGAYLFRQLHEIDHWSIALSMVVTVGAVAASGALTYLFVMRPLRHASSLARVVATLGLLATAQGATALIWGSQPTYLRSILPFTSWTVHGVTILEDRLLLVGIAAALTFAVWAITRYSTIGLALRAAAANRRGAAALGWSPDLLGTLSWSLGAALAGFAGILVAPLAGLDVDQFPLIVIPVTAAALIGGFVSYPLTLVGAIAIGIAQSETSNYVPQIGFSWAVPFVLIVVLLVVRGKGLPIRGYFAERLPEVGTGRIRPWVLLPLVAIVGWLCLDFFSSRFLDALTVSLGWATIMLSVVVLLGFTSQLSFEQMAMAALSGLVATRLVVGWDWPIEAAILASCLVSVLIGLIFAVPALRVRGINLAVTTLGFAVLIYEVVILNPKYTGGQAGLDLGKERFLGITIDPTRYPDRYAIFALGFFIFCSLAVLNVRRGSAGGALIAIRSNERAAAALGINVFTTKIFAFVIGAMVAGFGGVVLAFRYEQVSFFEFTPSASVLAVSFAVIGGVGYVIGPIAAAPLVAGGIGGWMLKQFFPDADYVWLTLLGGINVIAIVVLNPDGVAAVMSRQVRAVLRAVRRGRPEDLRPATLSPDVVRPSVKPLELKVDDLTVRFGVVTAVDEMSLSVGTGEIVGLIGPNGAGKTTAIDAITGFVSPASGRMLLGEKRVEQSSPDARARLGLSRSFQSLELFEESTIEENLRVASDPRGFTCYLRDVVWPRRRPLSVAAVSVIHELGLENDLRTTVSDLPYGTRRLVAIARAIATNPSILLLDEPVAGLSRNEREHLAVALRRLVDNWGIGILLVEHDMGFVMTVCDRLVVLDFGKKIAEGPPADVQRNKDVIDAYLGADLEEEPDLAGLAPGADVQEGKQR